MFKRKRRPRLEFVVQGLAELKLEEGRATDDILQSSEYVWLLIRNRVLIDHVGWGSIVWHTYFSVRTAYDGQACWWGR